MINACYAAANGGDNTIVVDDSVLNNSNLSYNVHNSGGFVGINNGIVTNCFANARMIIAVGDAVTPKYFVGAFVGNNFASGYVVMDHCYSRGSVSGEDVSNAILTAGSGAKGGLIGHNQCYDITNSFDGVSGPSIMGLRSNNGNTNWNTRDHIYKSTTGYDTGLTDGNWKTTIWDSATLVDNGWPKLLSMPTEFP